MQLDVRAEQIRLQLKIKASRVEVLNTQTVGVCCLETGSWRWKLGPHLDLPSSLSW